MKKQFLVAAMSAIKWKEKKTEETESKKLSSLTLLSPITPEKFFHQLMRSLAKKLMPIGAAMPMEMLSSPNWPLRRFWPRTGAKLRIRCNLWPIRKMIIMTWKKSKRT